MKKIIELAGHPLSGMRILWVEDERGNILPIFGDWRPLVNLVEEVGIGGFIE